MNNIKDIISSLFIYSNEGVHLYKNAHENQNKINDDYTIEKKENCNKVNHKEEDSYAIWKKEREKLPIINHKTYINEPIKYYNNNNSSTYTNGHKELHKLYIQGENRKSNNNDNNEDNKNNYVAKNLLQLKQQEAKVKEMKQYQENELKIKEHSNRAYLHISSRLLEKRPINNELLRRVKERKEMQNERYNKTAAGNRNSCSYDRNYKNYNKLLQQPDKKLSCNSNSNSNNNNNQKSDINDIPMAIPSLIKINNQTAIISSQSPIELHKDFGKTPEYLKKKKEELKEQKENEKQKEKEKKLPKGMRLVPENERQEKLKSLSEMKKELENELGKMPIARISKRTLNRKIEIEELLRVIDIDIAKYSMIEVLIPIDNS